MAFNPFHAFRRHQRPLIAALAIFCMIMFVLSSGIGRGDAVYQVLGFFGAARGKGSVVATLHGRKITESELARLRRDRELASKFLFDVSRRGGVQKVVRLMQELPQNRDNPNASSADTLLKQSGQLLLALFQDESNRFAREDKYRAVLSALGQIQMQARLAQFSKPESARPLEEVGRMLAFQLWKNDPQRSAREFYFGGTPDTADLLDFILWEQQADRLGVVLTEADIVTALNQESGDQGLFSASSLGVEPLALEFIGQNSGGAGGLSPEQLAGALNREFRCLIAQESVLGREGGVRAARSFVGTTTPQDSVPQVPAAETPREFLNWFKERRTTVKVAVLPISVEKFVDQVKATPTEAALQGLYDAYKADEPAPDRQAPGFKEPRRVRIETVSARSDSPFYQEAGRARAVAPAAGALFGGPFGGPIAAGWPVAFEPLARRYADYVFETRSYILRGFGVGVDLTDRRPEYAAISGLTVGATPGGILAAATTAGAENVFYNVGLAKVAGSILPAGAGAHPLAAVANAFSYQNTVLPPEDVEATLFAKVIENLAPEIVTKNLDEFITELAKLKSRPSEAEAYITKSIKSFGLTHTLMAEPKTSYQLESDPALQGLKLAAEDEAIARISNGEDSRSADLAPTLLNGVGVYDPQRFPSIQRWITVKEPFVWWRVKDLPAHERPYEAVKGEVERAWRFMQARALAQAAAERIEAAVKKNVADNKSAAEVLRVLRSYAPEFGPEFELNDVARLLPAIVPQPESGQPYVPYSVPRDRIAYPRADFVDRLLTLKEPGDVVLVRNKPASTVYVAVLEERFDPITSGGKPNLSGFLEEYRNADKTGSLWKQQFIGECRRAYIQEVEKQMRIDATGGKVDEQGNILLPEGFARSGESESGE